MSSVLVPVNVVYCGKCGMPPEYCEYGPDYESHCLPWLKKNEPDLYKELQTLKISDDKDRKESSDAPSKPRIEKPWTTEERLTAFYKEYQPDKLDSVPSLLEKYAGKEDKLFVALVKKYGPEPIDPYYEQDFSDDEDDEDDSGGDDEEGAPSSANTKKRRGVAAKKTAKTQTRVVIQKVQRQKKKSTTIITGMETVPNLKLKDVSKAFSKRFAGSSSVKDGANQKKEIIIQGDHMTEVAEMIVDKFNVDPASVFMDMNGEFVPFG